MSTFLYLCPIHNEFEEEHSIKIKLELCPHCQLEGKETSIKRLINFQGGGVVELYGQDLVDKVKADASKLKRDAAKNEKIYSNLLGESRYNDLQSRIDKQK